MVDKIMNYDEATYIVEEKGWDAFLETLQNEYPNYDLYKCSMDWYKSDEYICKVKGVHGDVLIGWKHKVKNKEMIQCY